MGIEWNKPSSLEHERHLNRRMKLDEAESESNRVRAVLERLAGTQDVRPTAEDYEQAQAVIDALRDREPNDNIEDIFNTLPIGTQALTLLKGYFMHPADVDKELELVVDPEFSDDRAAVRDEMRRETAVREKVWDILNKKS